MHLISEFERVHYWNGISMDPPELLYRSDPDLNPFPVPPPGTSRWFELPVKTAEGVFGTPLNAVWHIVAPMMVALLKKRGIKYSALKTVRFSTRDEDGKKTLGPIVIWIATHPNTTSAEDARDASPDILHILKEHKVEGSVEKLSGPALMRVADEPTQPTTPVAPSQLCWECRSLRRRGRRQTLRVASLSSSTRSRPRMASLVLGSSPLATSTSSARIRPWTTSSWAVAHLANSFESADSLDSSASPTRSEPWSLGTSLRPSAWLS